MSHHGVANNLQDAQDEKKLGPREALGNFYSLRGELPAEISQDLFPQQLSQISEMLVGGEFKNERKAVLRLLRDARVSDEQREEISRSILMGQFQMREDSPSQDVQRKRHIPAKDIEKIRTAHLTMNRHNLRKPNFLEVVSQSAELSNLSRKQSQEHHVAMLRQMSSPQLDMKRIHTEAALSSQQLLNQQHRRLRNTGSDANAATSKVEQARRCDVDRRSVHARPCVLMLLLFHTAAAFTAEREGAVCYLQFDFPVSAGSALRRTERRCTCCAQRPCGRRSFYKLPRRRRLRSRRS